MTCYCRVMGRHSRVEQHKERIWWKRLMKRSHWRKYGQVSSD